MAIDSWVTCRTCHTPIPAREGQFRLKYFVLRQAARPESTRACRLPTSKPVAHHQQRKERPKKTPQSSTRVGPQVRKRLRLTSDMHVARQ